MRTSKPIPARDNTVDAQTAVIRALDAYARSVGPMGMGGTAALAGEGPIAELEARLTRHYGMRHAVCMSSATMGLMALAHALGLEHGEIVTTPLSYGATIAPFLALGSQIVFADVEPDTLTLDPAAVRTAIGPDTRAILAVDVMGVPSDSRSLREVADAAGVWYLADAAQSLGASRDGRPASAEADAVVVSFGVGKTVFSGGEGGAVLTDNDEICERLLWFAQHPLRQARDLGPHRMNEFAMNGRMSGLAAAWANAVFEPALEELAIYQDICFEVLESLEKSGWIEPTGWRSRGIHPAFFRLSAAWKGEPRPRDVEALLARIRYPGVVRGLPVKLLYNDTAFQARVGPRARLSVDCPVAERVLQRSFSLELKMAPPPRTSPISWSSG